MRVVLLAALLASLAGVGEAADAPSSPDGGPMRDGPRHHGGMPNLFISPSGQPFRSAPGEPYPVAKWFAGADKKGDGRIDRAEFRADAKAFFDVLDENHDGVIDGFELNDYEQKVAPEISGAYGAASGDGHRRMHRGPQDGGGRGAQDGGDAGGEAVLQGAAVFGLLNEPEPVAAADLDLSGRITLDEFMTVTDRRFDELDTKHLGYLTLANLPKTQAQLMAEHPKRGVNGQGDAGDGGRGWGGQGSGRRGPPDGSGGGPPGGPSPGGQLIDR